MRTLPDIATPYVSFDVFGTLITRVSGSSHSVFRHVERRAILEGLHVEGFVQRREAAECQAVARVGYASMTLDDIYTELINDYSSNVAEHLKNLERQAEIDLCVPIEPMVRLFRRCVSCCKEVVLVSDMYLPSDVICQMLAKCDIKGYRNIYVSCEHAKTKEEGSLFGEVLNEIGAEPTQMTHVGDNLRSDYKMPRRIGMHSVLVRDGRVITPVQNIAARAFRKIGGKENSRIQALCLSASDDSSGRIGYTVLGPVLVSFCEWVHKYRVKENLDGLFFAARDGWVMKRCYDLLYPGEQTTYLLVSRRSTTVPLLWANSGISGFAETAGLGREMTVGEILVRLGLDEAEAHEVEAAHGLTDSDRMSVSELAENPKFLAVFHEIESNVLESSRREFSAMRAYVTSAFGAEQAIGFVDLGWRGSIQRAIETALQKMNMGNVRVEGLYFGIDPTSRWFSKQVMHGFMFSKGQNESLGTREKWFNALVEAFFSAPHGTVLRYVLQEDGKADAELAPRESGNEDTSPLFAIQDAALDFARAYKAGNWGAYGLFKKDFATDALFRLGLTPTSEEASFLGDIIFEYQEATPLAEPSHGLGWYIFHMHQLAADLNVCYWKPAFFTRLAGASVPWWRFLSVAKSVARH